MTSLDKIQLRKYSITEIDAMRSALKKISNNRKTTGSDVEDQLRTHMINGTDPEDLEQHAEAVGMERYRNHLVQGVNRWRDLLATHGQNWQHPLTGKFPLLELRRAVFALEAHDTRYPVTK